MLRTTFLAFLLLAACSSPSGDGATPDAAPAADAAPDASPEPTFELVGTFEMPMAADVAARGSLVAVSRWEEGSVALIDASDPSAPVLFSDIENIGYNSDVQLKGDLLFINHENVMAGFDIYDVSDPKNPALVRRVGAADGGDPSLADCHNLWPQPDRDLLYCASTATFELAILSLGEGGVGSPENPELLTKVTNPGDTRTGVHDMYALGDRLYVSYLSGGFAIYDITDPAAPQLIGSHNYANSFNHNIWPSADGDTVFTSDEQAGGHLRVFDISDLASITQVGEYTVADNSSIHNVEVVGDLAYISWYTEGVRVLDVSDPSDPVEIGADDWVTAEPDPQDQLSIFQGDWGVEPAGDLVYTSSLESGLRVYRLTR